MPKSNKTATDRPAHVYGYRRDNMFVVEAAGSRHPVRYPDTDSLLGIAPKIGNAYRFINGHVVARTVPNTGGRPKKPGKMVTRSYTISPAMAQRLDADSDQTGESKSAFVEAALQLLFGE